MPSATRSATARDADTCRLAHLPPELLPVIFEHSTALDLACWALTNGHWARAITPALVAFWKTYEKMCSALKEAASFEELEAVPKISASCTMGRPTHPPWHHLSPLSVDVFRDEASFAELKQKTADGSDIEKLWYHNYISDVDASDTAARLDAAKICFKVRPQPWLPEHPRSSVQGPPEWALAIATTMRLQLPELMEVTKSWLLTVPSENGVYNYCPPFIPSLVGAVLGGNLHRAKIDHRKVAELLPLAIEMAGDDGPTTSETMVVNAVLHRLPSEQQQQVARILRPQNEPENTRFWFEFLFCECIDGEDFPYFSFGLPHSADMIETFCSAIDARVLAKLIEITVEEEEDEADNMRQQDSDGNDPRTTGEIHELTVDLLRGWVAARNFPAEPLPAEEQAAFLGILTSLNDDIKSSISREVLNWVLTCSQLPATVRLLCSAVA